MPEVLATRGELASFATFVATASVATALFLLALRRRRPVAGPRTERRHEALEPPATSAALTTPLLFTLVVGAALLLVVVAPLSRIGSATPALMALGIPGFLGFVYASRRRVPPRTTTEGP